LADVVLTKSLDQLSFWLVVGTMIVQLRHLAKLIDLALANLCDGALD
jgi:hypothetical protein